MSTISCVPECHQKGVRSSTRERGPLVSAFASEGKTDGRNKFTIAKGTDKICLLHFRLDDCRKLSPIAFNSKLLSFGSVLSLVLMTGAIEVHLLGDIFGDTCFVRFSLSKVEVDLNNCLFFQEVLFFTVGYVLAVQIMLECWQTPHKLFIFKFLRSSNLKIQQTNFTSCGDRELTSFVSMNCMDPPFFP